MRSPPRRVPNRPPPPPGPHLPLPHLQPKGDSIWLPYPSIQLHRSPPPTHHRPLEVHTQLEELCKVPHYSPRAVVYASSERVQENEIMKLYVDVVVCFLVVTHSPGSNYSLHIPISSSRTTSSSLRASSDLFQELVKMLALMFQKVNLLLPLLVFQRPPFGLSLLNDIDGVPQLGNLISERLFLLL